jgi:dTDP-4-amino-4,6-dideoxygalactose transaminase
MPDMTYYRNKYNHKVETEFPNALMAFTCGLALPIYSTLKKEQIQYISQMINEFK